jgi:hypothetical protein
MAPGQQRHEHLFDDELLAHDTRRKGIPEKLPGRGGPLQQCAIREFF